MEERKKPGEFGKPESAKKPKATFGLDENVAGLLVYVLGFITGIVFFVAEKENKFVRFHAMQSIITFICLAVLSYIVGVMPVFGWLIANLVSLGGFVLWIVLMIKAYHGEMYKLPVVGDLALKYSSAKK